MSSIHRGAEWKALSRRLRPQIEASLPAACIEPVTATHGAHIIWPGQKWHLGHRLSAAKYPGLALVESNIGPACAKANLSNGGRDGAQKINDRKRRNKEGGPKW